MAATRDEWRSEEGISGDEEEESELEGGDVVVHSLEASGSEGRRGEQVAPSSSAAVQIRDDALSLFQSHYLNNFLADPAAALLTLRSSYSIVRYAEQRLSEIITTLRRSGLEDDRLVLLARPRMESPWP